MQKPNIDPFDEEAGVPKIEGEIKPKPKYSDRISKRVLWVIFGVVIFFFVIFFLALDAMDKKKATRAEDAETKPKSQASVPTADLAVPKDLLDAVPEKVKAPATVEDDLLGGSGTGASLTQAYSNPAAIGSMNSGLPDNGLGGYEAQSHTAVKQKTPEQQAAELAKMEREKRMQQARDSGLSAKPYSADLNRAATAMDPANLMKMLSSQTPQAPGSHGGFGIGNQQASRQDTEQDEKLNFIQNGGRNPKKYLENLTEPAVSPNELKRGSYLAMRLEGDVHSGQPGMVRARVTEDVYDTVTGCRLLVPAMTMVQGTYNSKVAIGQTRNLIVWNYMAFEDGSDLDLGAMQGYDSSGAAGMEADVDNHYLRLFGMAFGMSMVTAGVQMSVPQSQNQNGNTQTPQQAIANSLTQQYGQLGAQLLGNYMQIQPTLRNYAGERFTVMLPLTVVFKKVWRNRCSVSGGV